MKIEVGKKYLNRNGEIKEISGYDGTNSEFPYYDTELRNYTSAGRYLNSCTISSFDLVSRYNGYNDPSLTKTLYGIFELNPDCNNEPYDVIWTKQGDYDNVKVEFCLETGKLLSIELIK